MEIVYVLENKKEKKGNKKKKKRKRGKDRGDSDSDVYHAFKTIRMFSLKEGDEQLGMHQD